NSKIAWAVGNNGIVYQTIDGGNTWERFAVGNTSNLLSVTFAKKNGYITGIGGMVRKFVVDSIIVNPVGINQITQSESIDIKAYPNPVTDKLYITGNFNGTTYVNISVRDINGKLVQNIINETTNGQLTKELNVSKLGTGIYFIHVQEGDRYWVQKIIKM
ncbi:MAG: T9SS type A sorting domain-containing protein, partial [Bacteroidota bacterium]|nr:T9SS type A sorting domain-containing protein [Bacteroidota bacterium]